MIIHKINKWKEYLRTITGIDTPFFEKPWQKIWKKCSKYRKKMKIEFEKNIKPNQLVFSRTHHTQVTHTKVTQATHIPHTSNTHKSHTHHKQATHASHTQAILTSNTRTIQLQLIIFQLCIENSKTNFTFFPKKTMEIVSDSSVWLSQKQKTNACPRTQF